MPERERYAHLFDRNPFEGKNPEKVFSLLNWGNAHQNVISIEAPEPLVMLGMTALLKMKDRILHFGKGEAFMAVGTQSNEIYIIPRVRNEPIPVVHAFSRQRVKLVGQIKETHYLSTKGGNVEHYYYHKHQSPYPSLWIHLGTGVGYLRAAPNGGQPSYAVGAEGIVG